MKHRSLTMALALILPASAALAQVDFVEPKNGDTVPSTFTVRFAVEGMSVAPAGELKEGTGHHHLLIDTADIDENAVNNSKADMAKVKETCAQRDAE